jgi:hypothetical protein
MKLFNSPSNYLKRHCQIKPETNSLNSTAKVTLYFTQQEFTDFQCNFGLPGSYTIRLLCQRSWRNMHIKQKKAHSSVPFVIPPGGAPLGFEPRGGPCRTRLRQDPYSKSRSQRSVSSDIKKGQIRLRIWPFVIPLGFEPRTHTLKVYCSTS